MNTSIRDATVDDRFALARIIIDATSSAFRGIVPDACFNWLTVEESATNWGRSIRENDGSECLLVVEVEEMDIVALILAGRSSAEVIEDGDIASRYPKEILSLQVDPAWQRRGLGRRLIQSAAQRVCSDPEEGLLVRVLEDNPNIAFYKALGAEIVGSQPYDWEGYQTSELLMAWESAATLTK